MKSVYLFFHIARDDDVIQSPESVMQPPESVMQPEESVMQSQDIFQSQEGVPTTGTKDKPLESMFM